MRRVIVGFCLVTAFVGCSSDDGDDTPSPPAAGGGATAAGGVSSGGSTASGGASTGGTSSGGTTMAGSPGNGGRAATTGGSASTGGRTGGGAGGRGGATGGSGGGATGGTPSAPDGPVDTCNGQACPLGECDNGGFFSDEKCSDVYSAPVDEESTFCSDDGGYCLTTITNVLTRWAITCAGGTPMFDHCEGGCLVAGDAATCN